MTRRNSKVFHDSIVHDHKGCYRKVGSRRSYLDLESIQVPKGLIYDVKDPRELRSILVYWYTKVRLVTLQSSSQVTFTTAWKESYVVTGEVIGEGGHGTREDTTNLDAPVPLTYRTVRLLRSQRLGCTTG